MAPTSSKSKPNKQQSSMRTDVRNDHGEASLLIASDDRALYDKVVAVLAKPIKPRDPARDDKLMEVTNTIKRANIFDTYWVCYAILWQWDVMHIRQVRTDLIKGDRTVLLEIPDNKLRIAWAIEPKRKLIKYLDRIVAQKVNRRDAALRLAAGHCSNLGALLLRAVEQVESRRS